MTVGALSSIETETSARAAQLLAEHRDAVYRRTDKMFAVLMLVQWLCGIITALVISPRAWAGSQSTIHPHLLAAVVLGSLITVLPVWMAVARPGTVVTRQTIAIGQALMSALLIHLSGGRIETHFHVFGSLAFLSCYRDWKVLITASVVVALDHLIRGVFFPQSVYGVQVVEPWRWVEHSGWVVFEDIFLIVAIKRSIKEMFDLAERQAELESTNRNIEKLVNSRTVELLASEKRFKTLSNRAPVGIFQIAEGKVTYANPRWEEIFELSAQFDLWIERIHPDDRLSVRESWHEALNRHTNFQREFRVLGELGSLRWVSLSAVHQPAETTEEADYIGIVEDISDRKEAERRVAEFYSMVSHELRTPLASIRGSLGLLEGGVGGDLSESAAELVQIARLECDRLVRLINTILDAKKIETGQIQLVEDEVDPERLAREVMDSLNGYAQELRISMILDVHSAGPINCDRDRIAQVLTNLLSNAIKFSRVDDQVILRIEETDKRVRFSIIDRGPGIAECNIPKLFQKFQQLDSSDKRAKGGTGLGLAISKALVEQHGGTIGVRSIEGKGSVFWFELPTINQPTQENTRARPRRTTPSSGYSRRDHSQE